MTENELLEEAADARIRRHGLLHAWTRTTCSATSRPKATCRTKATSASAPTGPTRSPTARSCRRRASATNLLVPVCVSSSHIAFGSIRMEPVFMILGQSAATAAAMAIDGGIAVQDVPYAKLRERLLADGQVLEMPDYLTSLTMRKPVQMTLPGPPAWTDTPDVLIVRLIASALQHMLLALRRALGTLRLNRRNRSSPAPTPTRCRAYRRVPTYSASSVPPGA